MTGCDWWEQCFDDPDQGRCLLHGDEGCQSDVCWHCTDCDEKTEEELVGR